MSDSLLIIISTVLVNNFVLTKFLGLCPFMGISNRIDSAIGMSLATTFVLTIASGTSYIIHTYLLIPFDLTYLSTLSFIVVIAAIVQLTEIIMQKTSPLLHQVLGLFLPLITTNCAVLGVALLNIRQANTFIDSIVYGIGAALGFSLVLIIFSSLREHLESADIPSPFKGPAIALITAGFMSLAFMGFTGLIKE